MSLDYVERAIPSKTKHKVIQGVLYKVFDIETLGRGIKRAYVAYKSSGIRWKCGNRFSWPADGKKAPWGLIPLGGARCTAIPYLVTV